LGKRAIWAIPVLFSILILGTLSIGFSFDDAFAKVEKVTICHKPGTVDEETKQVPENALKGHLKHGDSLGECEEEPPTASQGLIINEFDYDNPNDDTAEFLELYNPTSSTIEMTDFRGDFIDATDCSVYFALDFDPHTLGPDEYYVLGTSSVVHQSLPPGTAFVELPANFFNDGPGAIRITTNDGQLTTVDAFEYESETSVCGFAEGTPHSGEIASNFSLARVPNAVDTNDNSVDFILTEPTPGTSNS